MLHPTELRWTLLSYTEPTELRCSLLSYAAPCELHYSLTELPSVHIPLWNFVGKCWNAGLSGTGISVPQSGTEMLRYRTEMLDAGISMPAASASIWWTHLFKVNKWWLLAILRLKLVKNICQNNWNFLSLVICICHSGAQAQSRTSTSGHGSAQNCSVTLFSY